MAKTAPAKTYQQLQAELSGLIAWFESDKVNLDEAVAKYEQAMRLLDEMEKYLASAKNKVEKIQAKF